LRPRGRRTALALLLFCAAPAWAWQPETRIRMVDEAVRLMPASLRTVLESHREPLLRGLLEPQMHEDRPEHLEHTESHPPRWRKRLIVALMVAVTASIVGRAYFQQTQEGAAEAHGPTSTSPIGSTYMPSIGDSRPSTGVSAATSTQPECMTPVPHCQRPVTR